MCFKFSSLKATFLIQTMTLKVEGQHLAKLQHTTSIAESTWMSILWNLFGAVQVHIRTHIQSKVSRNAFDMLKVLIFSVLKIFKGSWSTFWTFYIITLVNGNSLSGIAAYVKQLLLMWLALYFATVVFHTPLRKQNLCWTDSVLSVSWGYF